MADFNNLNDLLNHLQKNIGDILKTDVADVVKQEMHNVIEEVTYEQYTPTQYIRTHRLSDVANMEVAVINNDTIQIINTRHDGDRDIARVVATGIGYSWTRSAIAQANPPFDRNFYEDTINFLRYNGKHIKAMKNGLKNKGYTVM